MHTQKFLNTLFAGIVLTPVLLYAGYYTIDSVIRKSSTIQVAEELRAKQDREESYKFKCEDPSNDLRFKIEKYRKANNIRVTSEDFEVLKYDSYKDSWEYKQALELKTEGEVLEVLCAEAEKERQETKPATTWEYFKSNWQKVLSS